MLNEIELLEVKEIAKSVDVKIDFIDKFNILVVGKNVIDFEIGFDMQFYKVIKYESLINYNKEDLNKCELRMKFKSRI